MFRVKKYITSWAYKVLVDGPAVGEQGTVTSNVMSLS